MFEPAKNCQFCPRLADFRAANQRDYPHFFNAPVPAFGDLNAKLLIVGLAPGLQGANATGRPFTGDYAGDVLYEALLKNGFAEGAYQSPRGNAISGTYRDGLTLVDCRITNAVRCVPPENKPEPKEIKQCNSFLKQEIAAMPNLKVILSLGLISHNAVLAALGKKAKDAKFVHGAAHPILATNNQKPITLINSYHCSRYNINTNRLTTEMFDQVMKQAKALI